jgi:hypothetical protein
MGWFSKKQSSDADRNQQAMSKPFIADDQIVARVAELMTMFNDAVGNDAMLRTTARGISSAAGLASAEHMLRMNIPAEVWMDRPWKMLAAVALRMSQNGGHFLAARIFGFTSYWGLLNAPYITPADFFDVLLTNCPPVIEAEIAAIAFISLLLLPAEQVIFSNATESVTVGHLTWTAANVLVHAPEKGIQVDDVVLATAKSYFG